MLPGLLARLGISARHLNLKWPSGSERLPKSRSKTLHRRSGISVLWSR
uniref:Uncharacterized protein n=1 Tax=Physcomitrium patens TaxID=3218 RepID=A0A2K1JPV7_PHYPA|nr:hypothetical protein PHYPA_015948 [Physcomitrium patens]